MMSKCDTNCSLIKTSGFSSSQDIVLNCVNVTMAELKLINYHFYTDIDECNSSPCLNNGICTDDVNGYTCKCLEGYSGEKCHKGTFLCMVHYYVIPL